MSVAEKTGTELSENDGNLVRSEGKIIQGRVVALKIKRWREE